MRSKIPLGAPDTQREGIPRVRGRPSLVHHGQGTHVVHGGSGALDDGQGGGLADGCLGSSFLPAST